MRRAPLALVLMTRCASPTCHDRMLQSRCYHAAFTLTNGKLEPQPG
jgi:hypothetical protein